MQNDDIKIDLNESGSDGFVLSKIDENGKKKTELMIDTPKTSSSMRDIPIIKELYDVLKPLKKVVRGDYYVLTNSVEPTEPRTYRNYYKKLLKAKTKLLQNLCPCTRKELNLWDTASFITRLM